MSGDQIPSPGQEKASNARGMPRGGGMLKLRFDWYISKSLKINLGHCFHHYMVTVCFTRQQKDTKKKRTRELRLYISFLHVA